MYLARFSYEVVPANRQRAMDFIRRDVAAARQRTPHARLGPGLPGEGVRRREVVARTHRGARGVEPPSEA